MYSFLVLGLIPGTNIQISFWAWMALMAGLLIVVKLYRKRVMSLIAEWWRGLDEIDELDPMHASHFHRRQHLTAR